MNYLLATLFSYLLGSVPFGYLVARAKGVDIRKVGSGNIGATNVFRTLGKGPGILTFVLDFAKGLVATLLLSRLAVALTSAPPEGHFPYIQLLAGVAAVIGHSFSVFLGFKGGKGVATGAGLAVGLAPASAGIGFGVWILTFLLSRYVSVASILAAAAVGTCVWIFGPFDPVRLVPSILTLLCLLIVVRHHANIRRLLAGTENRFAFTKAQIAAKEAKKAAEEKKP